MDTGVEEDGEQDGDAPAGISFWSVVLSTLAAAIGVQSKANKQRDFASGRVAPFIVAGLIFTALFVVVLVVVVRLVIGLATG
ncbi:MAG: DUF2970 domain-containing protein [Pseudomonadales bacterium]|jgi:hypothetical protein|nr:DUF2970 domain-containing protein [Pseudomonadales bacterium]